MTSLHLADNGDMFAQDDLTITTRRGDPWRAMLRLSGDLDMATSELLRAVLEQQIAEGRRFIRIDLTDVRFVDSSGLAVLADFHNEFMTRRGTMIILGACRRTRRLAQIIGLDRVLLLADSPPEPSPVLLAVS